jgi:hypothetical protein
MASQVSESDGREVKGKTPGQESLVSVGSTRTTLIAVPVIEVPTSQLHNTQIWITIIFNCIQSQILIHCNEYIPQNGKSSR